MNRLWEKEKSYPTFCKYCYEKVIFYMNIYGGMVYLNPDLSGDHRYTCTSSINPYRLKNPEKMEKKHGVENGFHKILNITKLSNIRLNVKILFNCISEIIALRYLNENWEEICRILDFNPQDIDLTIKDSHEMNSDELENFNVSPKKSWYIEFIFEINNNQDNTNQNENKELFKLDLSKRFYDLIKLSKSIKLEWIAKKLNVSVEIINCLLTEWKEYFSLEKNLITDEIRIVNIDEFRNGFQKFENDFYKGNLHTFENIPEVPEKMQAFFFQDRSFTYLKQKALEVIQYLSRGINWKNEKLKKHAKLSNFIGKSKFQCVGVENGLIFALLEYSNTISNDLSTFKPIRNKTIQIDNDFYDYVFYKTDLINFLRGKPRKLVKKDRFKSMAICSIFYLLKKISKIEFRSYILDLFQSINPNSKSHFDNSINIENFLYHFVILFEKENTTDYLELKVHVNDFLNYCGFRAISDNELIQKMQNWFLLLDPYIEIRHIRDKILGNAKMITNNDWKTLNKYKFDYLINSLYILWPNAITEAYSHFKNIIQDELLSSDSFSPSILMNTLHTNSKNRGMIDELGLNYFNSLNPFEKLQEKIQINLPEIYSSYNHIKNVTIQSRQIIRELISKESIPFCELIFPGGYQIGKTSIIVKTNFSTILIDYGQDPASNLLPYWCPEFHDLDAVLISHLHSDHCGGLYDLIDTYKYDGPIYMNDLNKKFANLIFLDMYENKIDDEDEVKSNTNENIPDHYENLMKNIVYQENNNPVFITKDIELTMLDSGHVPGSSSFLLKIQNSKTLYITNDFNINTNVLPIQFQYPNIKPDYVIIEGTYALSRESFTIQPDHMLKEKILNSSKFLLIPALSLGRAQEILHIIGLYHLDKQKRIAIGGLAGKISRKLADIWFKDLNIEFNPPRDVKKLVENFDVLIASSGFLTKGLSYNVYAKLNEINYPYDILLTGYCPDGSLSHQLLHSETERCRFSSHCDHQSFESILTQFQANKIFMIHTPYLKSEILEKYPFLVVPNVLERYRLF